MVWEKNVQTLVMLTRCNEQGRVSMNIKKYFVSYLFLIHEVFDVPCLDCSSSCNCCFIADLLLPQVKTTEVRSVRHFHFTAWPDHGVPETTELLISFRHLVREHMNQYSRNSPTVVHCRLDTAP
uniref:protein-tyrosine-phosphatase n=1 Tax=Poecilia mexicana TaxID=48701 RepID=A0A3B3WKY7_9TELE